LHQNLAIATSTTVFLSIDALQKMEG
jgi:hypothetical protein